MGSRIGRITVEIAEERLERLQEVASRCGISAEELLRLTVEDLLAKPDDAFQGALEHVLEKNAELYRRLA